jgi:hypothetical protein
MPSSCGPDAKNVDQSRFLSSQSGAGVLSICCPHDAACCENPFATGFGRYFASQGQNTSVFEFVSPEIVGWENGHPFFGKEAMFASMKRRQIAFSGPRVAIQIIGSSEDLLVFHYQISGYLIAPILNFFPIGQFHEFEGMIRCELRQAQVSEISDAWDTCVEWATFGLAESEAKASHLPSAYPTRAEETCWAKTLKLAPRLARLAAHYFAGYELAKIAELESWSLATVRTYSRQLYEAAKLSGRSELCALMLRLTYSDHAQ